MEISFESKEGIFIEQQFRYNIIRGSLIFKLFIVRDIDHCY